MNFDLTHPTLSRLSYRAFYGNLPFQEQKIEEAKEGFSEFIRQIVIKGVTEGDIDPNIDLDLAVFVVDTLSNAFSNYIPKKIGIPPDKLAREGASTLAPELVKNIFNELVKILKFGLNNKKKLIKILKQKSNFLTKTIKNRDQTMKLTFQKIKLFFL